MSGALVRQGSFRGGEVDSELSTRDPRYAVSLRTCKNFLPIVHGALVNRAGTQDMGAVRASRPRYEEFVFSDTQVFLLEFTDSVVRFWTNDGQLLSAGVPYEVGTPYLAADLRRLVFAQAGDVITITHPSYQPRELTRISNTNWVLSLVNTTPQAYFGGTPRVSNPIPAGIVDPPEQWNAATTYAKGALVNRNQVGYISLQAANTNHQPDGTGDTWWSSQSWDATATYKQGDMVWQTAGYDGTAATLPANAKSQLYISLQNNNVNHRPDTEAGIYAAIATSFQAYWAPAIDASHPAQDWEIVVTQEWTDDFGVSRETLPSVVCSFRLPVWKDRALTLFWPADGLVAFSHTTTQYFIYAGRNGIRGFIGTAPGNTGNGGTFTWDGTAPDFGIQPPKGTDPFLLAPAGHSYPSGVTYHEQRRVFFRSDKKPSTFIGSILGDIARFDVNDPPQASDSYEWKLSSQQLEEIRSAKSFGRLCLFTGQGEFSAQGSDGTAIGPTAIEVRRHSSHGSSYVEPIEAEHALIFNTAKGNYIRDFFFDYGSNAYVGTQLCEFARHFFRGYTITAWAQQRVPYHLVWIARSDGALFSLTYDRAAQTVAFAQHPTDGEVQEVKCMPNGTEDALFLCVERGHGARMEKMASRDLITDQRLAWFLDGARSFDGRNGSPTTMKVTGASFNAGDLVTIDTSVASFAATDVNDQVVLAPNDHTVLNVDGTVNRIIRAMRATVTAFTSVTQVTARLEADLDPLYQNFPTTDWGFARDTITGLGHLEGEGVAVLADGVPQGVFTVVGGEIGPLAPPALIAVVGLPYDSDMELLDVAADSAKTNVKAVSKVTVEVVGSRGISAGEDFQHLRPAKLPQSTENFVAPPLVTGQVDVLIKASWNTGGRACVRQSDPLPLTITAVTREVEVGGRG